MGVTPIQWWCLIRVSDYLSKQAIYFQIKFSIFRDWSLPFHLLSITPFQLSDSLGVPYCCGGYSHWKWCYQANVTKVTMREVTTSISWPHLCAWYATKPEIVFGMWHLLLPPLSTLTATGKPFHLHLWSLHQYYWENTPFLTCAAQAFSTRHQYLHLCHWKFLLSGVQTVCAGLYLNNKILCWYKRASLNFKYPVVKYSHKHNISFPVRTDP